MTIIERIEMTIERATLTWVLGALVTGIILGAWFG